MKPTSWLRLSILLCLILGFAPQGKAANIIHEFYVPMPDAQIRTALVAIEPASGIVGTTMESVVSIVVTGAGSVVHYDEWEDGYEVDLNNPVQTTTKIWGDGNNANGVPPGYANDPAGLNSGAVINLRNQILLPRNPATVLYDGRDRFGGTKALVVTRTGWAVAPGTVLAGSVEVTATMDYGTNYIVPVGQDVSAASMFEVVGLMVMARENGTSVTVDINGPVGGGATTFTLNQGESYLISNGILKGATVVATKPVQTQLITGDIGARYETDWFTLYPTDQWSSIYYSPVGTAADGDQTYGFFYNASASPITINVTTCFGSGSFVLPATSSYQYLMPQNCGAKFQSANGETYFGIVMVGANPTANNVHDWGFTLVPNDSLTTEAVVGWGPGSSDLSQNGSPVWITPIAATRVYVDYDGDRNGLETDPKGNKYDVHFDMSALETRRVFDPDKDQSAMRVYTLDGTPIAAAWGQDPSTAGPGNPYLDVGTTVLPFPVPTLIKSHSLVIDAAPAGLSIGDTIEYRIDVDNKGLLPLGNLLVLDPLNPSLTYVAGSSKRDGVTIADNGSGTPFPLDESGYVIPIILRGGLTNFTYRCTINAAGIIANTASNSNYNLISTAALVVPPPAGSTPCGTQFTNAAGVLQPVYSAGALVYGTLTDPDANNNAAAAENITVVVNNTSNGDAEFITLVETGVNTGIFRNIAGLTTSTTVGSSQFDNTLLVSPGNSLSFTYTDPEFNETCSSTASIAVPTQNKYLYLSDPAQALDRIDPAATGDGTTASTASLAPNNGSFARSPNLAIPENNAAGVNDDLVISGAGAITDMNVQLQVTHTYVGDLKITLTHVDTNTTITILDRPGIPASANGCSGNNIQAILDDEASLPVESQCAGTVPTISGTFTPNNPLSGFDAQSLNGTWRLNVSDNANQDLGTLVAWQITATHNGGTPTATFTQSPAFASAFTMPAGVTPTVSAYYSVLSGSMPGSPAITAALQKNGTVFATSTSATASGDLLTFNFAALGGAQNFVATDVMSLLLTTAQPGVTFTIDFDSISKPSKITLPTTTVITNTELGVYDAPYPAGSLITGLASGTTVYVRGTASDPFGNYDITSMGLSIDGPGVGGDITATLNAGNVVATTTASKTYEYAWTVGGTVGTYNISTTANEGTEGINATRASSVNVTFLDLGTPSTTEFTSSLNGPGTNTYAGDGTVFVRIQDLDQNFDSLVAETITATITSAIGDSEYVILTETGPNTGIFVVSIPASTTAPNTHNNGTLHAVLGDVLTVNYVDPTDATDTGSDTATIPNNVAALTVKKTRVTPADGIAVINEAVQYTIQVTNTGNTLLSGVTLVDTFPTANFDFVNASVAPNSELPDGTLTWNIGNMTSGQTLTYTVNFTAEVAAASAVNTATATATGGISDNDTASVTITDPKVTITKTLISPNPGPANINDNVVFRITAQNIGDTAIATLPVEDTYSGADFEFVSATVTPDASGSGSLLWLDITGPGNLAVGNSITIDIALKAKGAAAPAINLAKAEYTVDVNGDPAPPAASSSTITLLAAKITGHVYNDVNQNGAYNPPGDSPLENITVSLYTDPNGDGNPADGTLIDITVTDVNGAYEFGNLATGNYVVVESQPPGYSSHSDTVGANDNRIPQVIASLTTFPDRNFFDFLTPPVSYASISGKVWNDANASATVNGGEVGIENVPVDLVEDTNNNGTADLGEPVIASTLTAADGAYSFGGLSAGNFVVVENDLFNWYSTADTVGPNNNMIPVALGAGQNVTGRDFLDVLTGTTGGKVFHDVNGNGSFDAGDVALANIDVIITDSLGVTQTVVTNATGDWTATVPPGLTTIDVQQIDPQFTAVFVTGHTQTVGTDTSTVTVVSGVNTPAGDDGFRRVGVITGHLYVDTNGDGDQDVGEPNLANVDVIITHVDNTTQTVSTNANGDWTATVPPGLTTVDIDNADPQFSALVLPGFNQTEGVDSSTVTAVANTTTGAGTDGFFNPGSITGTVWADTNNDDIGDAGIENVVLTLLDDNGNIIDGSPAPGLQPITATTNASGVYTFTNIPPGSYQVSQAQPVGYTSIDDFDGGNLNINGDLSLIVVDPGETEDNWDFIEEAPGSISGVVLADTDNNDTGDTGIVGVVLTLLDSSGAVIDGDPAPGVQPITATTLAGGVFTFLNVPPGDYRISEAQPLGYQSISDSDAGNLDQIANITVVAGTLNDGHEFVEEQLGEIRGTVFVGATPLENVVMTLFTDPNGDGDPADGVQIGSTVQTNAAGLYIFTSVAPGTYVVVETQPIGYVSMGDEDTTAAGDDATDAGTDNRIPVGITAGELDNGNNFTEACPTITVNPNTLPNGTVGTSYSQTLSATGGTSPYSFAVTSGVLPSGLTLSGEVISGTPNAADSETFTITATDANGCAGTREFTVASTCPTITLNPATMPNATVGTAYTQTVSATGGIAPYSFTVTGTLPTGITLSGATVSGTPTVAGTYNFTIETTDTFGCTGSRAFTIEATCPTITVNPSSLPDASVGTAYNETVSATGGAAPYTFTHTGTLPTGITLTGATLSGTPTAAGVFNFTIIATDANGCEGQRALTITSTCPTITVSPSSLGNGVLGTAYSETLSATGGTAPYTYSLTGSLPAGLTLSGATISGTPTAAGTFNFTITATDDNGCTGQRAFNVTTACPTITLASLPAPLDGGTIGVAYTGTITASGGTPGYTYALKAGNSLPAGLSINPAGAISGIPTASGGTNFIIVATDANGCEGEATFSISIGCPTITVTPGTLGNGVVGTAYGPVTFNQIGGAPGITWSQTGTLPAGMTFTPATAQLVGTPTEVGTWPITVIATDANGCIGSVNLSFDTTCPTITITPATLPDGIVGTIYSEALSASGGTAPYSFAVTSGVLPAGLSLVGNTITGTPTAAGTANFTITVTDDNGCEGQRALSITTACPTITVNPATLPDGVVGSNYSQTLSATGGTSPYTFAVTTGNLPAGLGLSGGVISGIPTAVESQTFTITATDTHGCTGTRELTITTACPTITVNPASLPDGVLGSAYNETLSATGGTSPYSYAVTLGALPSGLTLLNGVISGTPDTAGTQNFTITATDAHGCTGTRALSITSACPTITVNPATLPDGVAGTAYSQTLSASGGTSPYEFTHTGTLPTGLSLSLGGDITGTPTAAGTFSFTVTATDDYGCTGQRAMSIVITCPTVTVNPATLPNAVVGTTYSEQLTTTGGTAPYTYALTGSLPGGLNLVGDTITGTPTAAGTANFTITATDANGCEGQRSLSIIAGCPTITLASIPAALPSGTVGVAYTGTITAGGGTPAYTFAVKVGSALPPGLSINSSGAITGIPTTNGSTNTIIVATDANGCTGEATFTINIGCNTLAVTPSSLINGVVGIAYTPVNFNATGGTGVITWSHTGTLPLGMNFSNAGVLIGTPTEAGAFNLAFIATDENTCSGSVNIVFTTNCPTITVNPASLPDGIVGATYSQTLSATGGTAPYTFALTGSLPAGLNLVGDTITGTPTAAGMANFTITATDANGCEAQRALSVITNCPTITVNPASLPDGVVGATYSQTLSATGGTSPYTFALTGSLPAGLNLIGNTIAGTLTAAGTANFTITATDANGCEGQRALSISTACPTITVNPATLSDGIVGTSYNETLGATGGTAPYTFAVTSGTLPAGLNLVGNAITGTPTSTAAASFTITATDDHGCTGFRAFTVTPTCPTITVTPASLPAAVVGSSYNQTLGAAGGTAPYSFAVTIGSLPAGLNLVGNAITGTPTDIVSETFTITVTDDNGCEGSREFTVAPACPTITLSPTTLPDAAIFTTYSQTITVSGGTGPYTYAVTTGVLPSGLSLTGATISGEPTATGVFPFSITATDDLGCSGTRSFTLSVLSGTISGCVHRDDDNDDQGDAYISGVTVVLYTDPNGDGDVSDGTPVDNPFTSGVQPYELITDAFGNYQFEMIAPGSYVIVQTQPVGYLTAADRDDTADAPGSPVDAINISTIDNRIPVTVAAGETDDGNHFVEELPAVMGNLVWNDANGNGTKDSGESGIDGVIVELLDGSGNPIDSDPVTIGTQPTRTTTAGGGLYAFANLAPGSYRMRIGAPPSAYPQAATPVVSLDNGVDDDSNGSQLNPGGAITSPVIVLAANETDNTVDFGLKALVGVYSISGQVRDDYDLDGNFSDSDQPVANVNVELYIDSDGSGTFDAGIDTLLDTQLTNGLGQYQFASLPNGTYFVREIDPNPSDSTADTDGPNDNLIKVTISGSSSTGNDFLDAVDPAGYIYSPVDGRIIAGGSISVSGPGSVTILLDGSTGQYSFITDTAGTYTMTYSPPLGYMIDPSRPVAGPSFDPTGLSDPHSLGSAENPANPGYLTNFSAVGNPYYFTFDLAPGDPFIINNNIPLVEIKPTTFASWQYANPLGGQNGPTEDPDGDGFTNLEEFAFCYQPNSGVSTGCPLKIVRNGDGTLDAEVRRVSGITGVTYTLEYIADLTASGANGAGWTEVTTISPVVGAPIGGVEIADYRDLAQITALSGGKGYVRVKVSDGVNTVRTYAAGWGTKVMPLGCQSGGQPYLKCAIFSGGVDGVAGSVLDVTTSAGGSSIVGQFVPGAQYYVEVKSGDNAGHRWDVLEASTTATSIAIDTASAGNTKATVPANLAGDSIVVRQHLTFAEAYPPASFTGHTDPALADRLLFFDRSVGAFRVFWLFNGSTKRWVAAGDAFLTNRNNDVLDPCAGHFVHPKTTSVTQVYTGEIRENAFACPLRTGNNLITGGWPIDLSPAQMAMTNASGFTGNRDPAKSDRLHLWVGDTVYGTEGYDTHFYLVRGALNQWTTSANANLANENNVSFLKAHGGFSLQMISPVDWVLPLPWTP